MRHKLTIVLLLFAMVNMVACGKTDAINEKRSLETTTDADNTVSEDNIIEEIEKPELESESSVSVDAAEESIEESSEEEQEESSASGMEKDDVLKLYDDLLKKIISGEELIGDEGEVYDYSFAEAPGFALYDINKDGIDELFVTGRMNSEWHTYTIYFVKDGNVSEGFTFNNYDPDNNLWIYGFEFISEAYSFDGREGFIKVWELGYPFDEGDPINLTYEGQGTKSISESELNEFLSKQIVEPSDITWQKLDQNTDILGK